MKTSDSALRSLLHGATEAAFSDLVTLVTRGGTTVRWTTDTYDLVHGGNTYTAGGTGTAPSIQRGRIREAVGLEVSTLEVTLDCGTTAQIGGVALQLAALNGVLDDARVTVHRAYQSTPGGAVVGVVSRFAGVVSDCEVDSYSVRLRVQSDLYKFDEMLPRHLIREKCSWAWGDAGCGISVASWRLSGTQQFSDATAANWNAGGSPTEVYPYTRGAWVQVLTGANAGLTREVVELGYETDGLGNYTGFASLAAPLPSALAVGDTWYLYRGCDKTIAMCRDVFSNLTRRRGFDFVPPPDYVTR